MILSPKAGNVPPGRGVSSSPAVRGQHAQQRGGRCLFFPGRERNRLAEIQFPGSGEKRREFWRRDREKEDAKAALSFGERQAGINPEAIGLCGYSFGSMVAFPVAVEDARARAVAGIAPFVQPENLLNQFTRPKLLVCGTQDEFVPSRALEKVVQRMPEPKELALFPGVDHFWWEKKKRWPKEWRSFSGNI